MYFHKDGFPEEDEIVLCTVLKVQYNSVFVRLDEYGKQGLIHISEVSPGRIRNLRDFVKEGKVVVCKVLRVNKQRGHIDVSLRRVTETQRRMKLEERKAEQKAEKIVEMLAERLKEDPKKVYEVVASKVIPKFGMLNYAFSEVVENGFKLSSLGLDKKYADPLTEIILEKIKPKKVMIVGEIKIQSYAPNGVEIIKEALNKGLSVNKNLTIKYLGAGSWKISVVEKEFKVAEKIINEAVEAIKGIIEGHDGSFSYTKKEAVKV